MSDEGEDSPSRPKRKMKKVMVLSSASSSDSDDSGPTTSTRKKRLRVLSDDGGESSGSSVVYRRRRALPKLRDSETGSDSSDCASDHSGTPNSASKTSHKATNSHKSASGFASDSSEGNSDKCSICLMRFAEQQVGIPQNCEHVFCLDCITEWSKNVNTCPVDRIRFSNIIVRSCVGGRVLRTDPVKVVVRRSSRDMMLLEDASCQICGSTRSEETMLLCDYCDLGFHIECLTPPLTEIPMEPWLCPNCNDIFGVIDLAGVNFSSDTSEVNYEIQRLVRLRELHNSRMAAAINANEEPSTSTGSGSNTANTSRPIRTNRQRNRRRSTNTAHRTHRRKYKRRRNRTVIVQYEVQINGRSTATATGKRKTKKRKASIRSSNPRTVARRTHVRASVRAQLAAQRGEQRAGLPALSLFGEHFLEYCEEPDAAPGPALALRTPPAALTAYRQARRKMVVVPSPPRASAPPDLLSDILESQTLLHSRDTVATISVDGTVDIQLRTGRNPRSKSGAPSVRDGRDLNELPRVEGEDSSDRLDVTKDGGRAGRQAPAYPGQGRGGGWGGGYRGDYHRDRSAHTYRPYDAYGGQQRAQGNDYHANSRPDDGAYQNDYGRRPPSFPPNDEYFDRNRRHSTEVRPQRPERWPPQPPQQQHRPSFGGFDDPLDMRVGQEEPPADKPQPYRPLPEPPAPPALRPEPDKSEDERSDPDLVIDTEKYDPTEPTHDEESGDDAPPAAAPAAEPLVSAALLDDAVRQVLEEHRGLLAAAPAARSDDDSDGDCPNFSIYSATSVHIASGSEALGGAPAGPPPCDALEDLVQEDGAASPPAAALPAASPPAADPYKERLSKRCPITTNPRNPIKIKLNTPSLIKRQVSLYDEEDVTVDPEPLNSSPDAASAISVLTHSTELDLKAEETQESELQSEEVGAEPAGDERPPSAERVEKMTESISETEDERSYTPCLDENKSKDTSLDTDREKGIEGLDTEMISEDEGEEMFTDEERRSASPAAAPPAADPPAPEDGEIPERRDEPRRRRRKDKRDKKGKTKRTDVTFKKIGKNKERNYRDKDKKRRESGEGGERARRKREKRKDLERYDVRSVVGDKRPRTKDAFGRDVSPRAEHSPSPPEPRRRGSASPRRRLSSSSPRRRPSASPRRRPSASPRRRPSISPRRRPSVSPRRRPSVSPRRRPSVSPRRRPSVSPRRRPSVSPRRRPSVSPRRRPSVSPRRRPTISPRRRVSPSPRRRPSPSPPRRRVSPSPRKRASPSPRKRVSHSPRRRASASPATRRPRPSPAPSGSGAGRRRRRRSASRAKRAEGRRRRSTSRPRKRRRSASASPKPPKTKKKKRARSRSGKRAARRRSASAAAVVGAGEGEWARASPCTPPALSPPAPRRRDLRRLLDSAGPSKEVFTSGDNILVSVSFKEQESVARRPRRRRAEGEGAKPVAIIDLERSPFRELTPSPERIIVLSDEEPPAPPPAPAGPKTPPPEEPPAAPPRAPASPDTYDPFEPTRSASASPPRPPTPPPARPEPASPAPPAAAPMTLEAAQKTNMSADELVDRRPLEPIEKVMALLQSTRDVSPEPPPGDADEGAAPPPRIVLPEPSRPLPPKLFLAKPSPIKSDPIKPLQQATKLPRCAEGEDSPYSPGSSDFGDLFEPPPSNKREGFDALFEDKPRKRNKNSKKKGKTQVDVKLDDDNLKILEELPSSAVEMQVKSKFLKKLNRQERVVEEVKLVLKPHYNKKHVTKEEYKHILRRAVPKICHNKTGEINPTKIQALVEAYVKKFRKKHKLGIA